MIYTTLKIQPQYVYNNKKVFAVPTQITHLLYRLESPNSNSREAQASVRPTSSKRCEVGPSAQRIARTLRVHLWSPGTFRDWVRTPYHTQWPTYRWTDQVCSTSEPMEVLTVYSRAKPSVHDRRQ